MENELFNGTDGVCAGPAFQMEQKKILYVIISTRNLQFSIVFFVHMHTARRIHRTKTRKYNNEGSNRAAGEICTFDWDTYEHIVSMNTNNTMYAWTALKNLWSICAQRQRYSFKEMELMNN